jgi:hypothetical protein
VATEILIVSHNVLRQAIIPTVVAGHFFFCFLRYSFHLQVANLDRELRLKHDLSQEAKGEWAGWKFEETGLQILRGSD